MGICGYRSLHPAEDFIYQILSINKLNSKSPNDIQTEIINNFKNGKISQVEGLTYLKTLFDQDKGKNNYFNYHNRIFSYLLEKVFSFKNNDTSNDISSYYLIFVTFPFCWKVVSDNEKHSKVVRIQQFLDLVKKIEGKVSIGYRIFKEYLRIYLTLMTTIVTKAVLDEVVNSNEKPSLQEELKNLLERVFDEKNLEDYLTAITRDYETKYASRIDTSEVTLENVKEIFEKRINFFYIQDLRYEIVNNYAL